MRQNRRFVLLSAPAGSFALPIYSGSYAIFGDEKQGYIECYSSGILSFKGKGVVDAFILGSGRAGNKGTAGGTSYTTTQDDEEYTIYTGRISKGGNGGLGAEGKSFYNIEVSKGDYEIIVGAGCSSSSIANASSAFGNSANGVRSGAGSGATITPNYTYDWTVPGYSSYNNSSSTRATTGANGVSYPFGETSGEFYKRLGACGGGGGCAAYLSASTTNSGTASQSASGGTLGGGAGGSISSTSAYTTATATAGIAGTANTGGGGGGGGTSRNSGALDGGNGGSGIVIIRWGYAVA